jgi:hypothetical protein
MNHLTLFLKILTPLLMFFYTFVQGQQIDSLQIKDTLIVKNEVFAPEISKIALNKKQVLASSGVFNDPLHLAATYAAGIVQTNDGSNSLSIRGNSPNNIGWRLEGAEILNPNHFLNTNEFSDFAKPKIASMFLFNSETVDNTQIYRGNIPIGYGNEMGSIIDVHLQEGNNQKGKYSIKLDLKEANIAAQGPIGKQKKMTYSVGFRRFDSYLLDKIGVQLDNEKYKYTDFNFKLMSKRENGYSSIFGIIGTSSFVFNGNENLIINDPVKYKYALFQFSNTKILGFIDFTQINQKSSLKLTSTFSNQTNLAMQFNPNNTGLNLPNIVFFGAGLFIQKFTVNTLYSYQSNEKNQLRVGLNFINTEETSGWNGGVENNVNFFHQRFQLIPHFEWMYKNKSENITTVLGFQIVNAKYHIKDSYNYPKKYERTYLEPRSTITYHIHPKHKIEFYNVFASKKLDLEMRNDAFNSMRALNSGLGHTFKINEKWSLQSELFSQLMYRIPVDAFSFSAFNILNEDQMVNRQTTFGKGLANNYGLEFTLQKNLQNGWFMNANTTFLRSLVIGTDTMVRHSRWDVGKIAHFIFKKEWYKQSISGKSSNFGISQSTIFSGGLRDRVIDLDKSKQYAETMYENIYLYNNQLPNYFRIDLSFYWKLNFKKKSQTFALDFQNITNQKNIAFRYYDPHTHKVETKYQLGLIPNVSWRLEF